MTVSIARRITTLAILFSLLLSFASHPIKASSVIPDTLEEVAKSALGPGYGPLQLPNTQQAKLLASDKENDERFGSSVSMSADGNTALIGAYLESDSGLVFNGAVYVFIRIGNTWTQQAKLFASDRQTIDEFGFSVALTPDGNMALIGADNKSDNGIGASGAAYVFTRSGTVWTQQAKFLASDQGDSDRFGSAVALNSDGSTAIVGASNQSESPAFSNGAAYVFTRSGSVWTEQAKLLPPVRLGGEAFGTSVSLSSDGNMALIGASQTDDGASNNGSAFVFTRSGGVWTQQTQLLTSDRTTSDAVGNSVSLSQDGSTALIGAFGKSESGLITNGAAYVFTRSGSVWTEQAKLNASDRANNDIFGVSVSISNDGSTALIGASNKSDSPNTGNGAAYIFTRSGSVWTQQVKLNASDRANNDIFARAVALSGDGNTALIGAQNEDDSGTTNNGAAYVYVAALPTPTPTATNTSVPPRPDTIGVYKDGAWYLRNTNTSGPEDIYATYGGDPSDLPVVGDWNGDGMDTLGVYRVSEGRFYLSDSNTGPASTYVVVLFGNPADMPFAGKWTADMTGDGIGVYRNSNGILYQRKSLTSGFDDFFAVFGNPGDQGFAGDWDGNGFDSIGVYRSINQMWYMTNNSTPNGITLSDINFVWDIGSYPPVIGDWDGIGGSTVGYLTSAGTFDLHSALASAGSDNTFAFGPLNGKPIAGKWVAASRPPVAGVVNPSHPGSNVESNSSGD